MLKFLAAVGALGVILAGILVYLVGSTAIASGKARSDSIALLESVRTRANDAQAALRTLPPFDVASTSPDFAKARQTADQYATQLNGYRTSVQADEGKLRADRDRLVNQAGGVFALPFRGALDHERQRAEGLLFALQAEDTGLQIEVDQMRAISAIFDAEGAFSTLVIDHLEKQDTAGALALFPSLDAKLKAAAQAATGQSTPPQLQKVVANMQTLSVDLNAFLQAGQRRDRASQLALQPKVQADATALQGVDTEGLEAYERTLLQPYEDRFDSGVRAAGFTPQQPKLS